MTSTDTLFNFLRIPWQVIINYRITKLEVKTFRTGICHDENFGIVFKIIDNCMLILNASAIVWFAMIFNLPSVIYFFCHGVIKVAVEKDDVRFGIAIITQLFRYIFLCAF